MSLTVELPAEALRRLEIEAARRGMTPDALASEAVAELTDRLPPLSHDSEPTSAGVEEFFGFVPFPKRGGRVTNELVDQFRDELNV